MRINMNPRRLFTAMLLAGALAGCGVSPEAGGDQQRPNILFVIADDQSFPHASAYGNPVFKTPAFDRVAAEGVLFTNAFVAAPQCSPSRAAILTGRNIWQLEEAGTHSSHFPLKFPVFTQVLEDAGYRAGYTGKGWGPGNWKDAGWERNPAGKEYNAARLTTVPTSGINKTDYVGNFDAFLRERETGKPFFFWFGAHEPHRDYEYGSGRAFLEQEGVDLPGFLPVDDSVVNDMLDYAREIAWFDEQLGRMIALLEASGELENTVIIVTADNGMPFPHAKASLQEYGIHVPLAIRGPSVRGGRHVEDIVSLIDLAPTILELAGTDGLDGASGRSLLPVLRSDQSGIVDTTRAYILSGRERHTHARPDNAGYPARAIRTDRFLYIRNFKPERWPMGDPAPPQFSGILQDADMKPILYGFEDVDDGPTKRVMIRERHRWPQLFAVSFDRRGPDQLYDITADPACANDLSGQEEYRDVLLELRRTLEEELTVQGDPRVTGTGDIFDTYPRFGRMRPFPGFKKRGEYNTEFGHESATSPDREAKN